MTAPYWNPHVYWFWRYKLLPWWIGTYGPYTPYPTIPKEQEIAILEDQKKFLEETSTG